MLTYDEQQGISSQEVHDLTSACEEMLTQEDDEKHAMELCISDIPMPEELALTEQKEEEEVPTIQEEELVCMYFIC